MSNMFRDLRIAFSVACGIVCLFLVVLWVRCYSQSDGIRIYHAPKRSFQLKSLGAAVQLYIGHYSGNDSGFRAFSVRTTTFANEALFEWNPLPECRQRAALLLTHNFRNPQTTPWTGIAESLN